MMTAGARILSRFLSPEPKIPNLWHRRATLESRHLWKRNDFLCALSCSSRFSSPALSLA